MINILASIRLILGSYEFVISLNKQLDDIEEGEESGSGIENDTLVCKPDITCDPKHVVKRVVEPHYETQHYQ